MKTKISKILGVGLTLALLVSLLLTAAPIAANVSQPTVTLAAGAGDNPKEVISKTNVYTIVFDVFKAVPQNENIKIKFPSGTALRNTVGGTAPVWADADIKIQATAGFGTVLGETDVPAVDVTTEDQTVTIDLDAAGFAAGIGEAASVKVKFYLGVTNPDDPGAYTLEVNTSKETTFVESASYTIKSPTLAGGISVLNSEGIQMSFTSDLNVAVDAVTDKDFTIEVGPGTYTIDDPLALDEEGLILKSTDGLEETIIEGDSTLDFIDITGKEVTITGFTIKGKGLPMLDVTNVTAEDCVIDGNLFYTKDSTQALRVSGADVPGLEITNNEFDLDDSGDEGIVVTGSLVEATISGNTFSGDGDEAIDVTVNLAAKDTKVSGNTITDIDSGIVLTAVTGYSKTLTVSDNLINGEGKTGITVTALDYTAPVVGPPAVLGKWSQVNITGNTIDYSSVNCIDVNETDIEHLAINWNNLLPKAKKDGLESATKANAYFNWWGTTVKSEIEDLIDGSANFDPWLNGEVASVASGMKVDTLKDALDAKTAANVKVSGVEEDGGGLVAQLISAAQYAANPVDALDGAIAFWDVYVELETGFNTNDVSARLKFYDSAITEGSVISYWTGDFWAECSDQDARDGILYVTIQDDTLPALDELEETIFGVEAGEAAAGIDTPVLLAPEIGAGDVSLSPAFAWGAVDDIIGYDFELADNANFVLPLVRVDGNTGRLTVTAYGYSGELDYSTAYYWRVKAVEEEEDLLNAGKEVIGVTSIGSEWVTGVFITMDEPEEVTPPVVVEEAAPVVIEPIVEVITPAPITTVITPSWIYVIIGVGAVLVIALLVLIVRTRRVA